MFASLGKILMDASTFAKSFQPIEKSYGPVKPHLTQRYGRPNIRHFSQRQIVTSPQLGQGNFTAPSPGRIVRAHHVHVGMRIIFSLVTEAVVLIRWHFSFHTRTALKVIN